MRWAWWHWSLNFAETISGSHGISDEQVASLGSEAPGDNVLKYFELPPPPPEL